MTNFIIDTVVTHLPNSKTTPNGWLSFNCPVCAHLGHRPDKKRRGGLIMGNDEMTYHCFNCSYKTKYVKGHYLSNSFIKLLEYIGVEDSIINKCRFLAMKDKNNTIQESSVQHERLTHTYSLPAGSRKLTDLIDENSSDKNFLTVLKYIGERNVNMLSWHNFYWSPGSKKDDFRNRLIIPHYLGDKIIGWSGRLAIESKRSVKYISQTNKDILFNTNILYKKSRKYVFIVEGEFDAISISGVATMSDSLSTKHIETLNSFENLEKIVIPDRDSSGQRLFDQAIELGWSVSLPDWTCKDCAEAVSHYGRIPSLVHLIEKTERNHIKSKILSRSYFPVKYRSKKFDR